MMVHSFSFCLPHAPCWFQFNAFGKTKCPLWYFHIASDNDFKIYVQIHGNKITLKELFSIWKPNETFSQTYHIFIFPSNVIWALIFRMSSILFFFLMFSFSLSHSFVSSFFFFGMRFANFLLRYAIWIFVPKGNVFTTIVQDFFFSLC